MTREDAIKIVEEKGSCPVHPWRTNMVDALIALGILKLDVEHADGCTTVYELMHGYHTRPPQVETEALKAIVDDRGTCRAEGEKIVKRLKAAGFKIVKT
jgi:hypothetical protein